MKSDLAHPDRKTIQSLFNSITDRYDFLNSFLSFGLHRYWRKRLVRYALTGLERSILDLGVGTGRSIKAFLKQHRFACAVGCDFSLNMLEKAKKKLNGSVELVACDFHELPFASPSFDLVTGSFILRSVQDMKKFAGEVRRIVREGGKAVFLELTRPQNRIAWNLFYKPYLRYCVPFIGKLFSKHEHAYEFLSESIQAFTDPSLLKYEFESAGFSEVTIQPIHFGATTIIQAK